MAEQLIVPLSAETLEIGAREVEAGRVRISKRVVERQEQVDLPLRRETVDIERVSVNRVVDTIAPPRTEGDVIIVPVYEEVLVVAKQLVLKEELRITRRSSTQAGEPRSFTVRREEIEIARSSDLTDDKPGPDWQ